MLYAMLYIKAAGKAVQIGFIPRPRFILILVIRQHGVQYICIIHITGVLLLWSLCNHGPLAVIYAIWAMDWRKQQVPSSGLAIQKHTEVLVLYTSQCVESLQVVKELVGPQGDARILRPKEWSNCHEGREVRYKVRGHNWYLRQFRSRFRKGKEPVSRIEEVVRNVVQGSHLEFTQALPRRNFGKYVAEGLSQYIFAAPFIDEDSLKSG